METNPTFKCRTLIEESLGWAHYEFYAAVKIIIEKISMTWNSVILGGYLKLMWSDYPMSKVREAQVRR